MKFVCRYAIVRFAPYAETEEFANVGVVLICPHAKYFGYKLIDRSIARVTAFFDELDANVFRNARRDFGKELERIGGLIERAFAGTNLQGPDLSFASLAFDELAKPRDSIMYVSEPRTILTNDPAEQLADLFDRYVARTFATARTYQERVIQKRIAAMLVSADLKRLYKEQDIGTRTTMLASHSFGSKMRSQFEPSRPCTSLTRMHRAFMTMDGSGSDAFENSVGTTDCQVRSCSP